MRARVPRVSVVLASYNRLDSLLRLLSCLSNQTLAPGEFEVIIVDDGSAVSVRSAVEARTYAFPVSVFEQVNAGPSAFATAASSRRKARFSCSWTTTWSFLHVFSKRT